MFYAIQPRVKYLAILGLVPYAEQRLPQRLQQLYTSVIIGFNLVAGFRFSSTPAEDHQFVSQLVNCIVVIARVTTMSVILLQTMWHHNSYFELCQQMKRLRLRYQSELQLPMRTLPRARYWKYLALVACTLGVLLVPIFAILHMDYIGSFWHTLCAVIITRCHCLLLMLYIEHIGYYAEQLAFKLQAVLSWRLSGQHCCLDVDYARLGSLEHLISLKRVYMELCRVCGRFNRNYGWSMLSIFVVLFLDGMINVYWTILTISNFYPFVAIYVSLFTCAPLLLLLFAFCRSGEYCKRQNALIGSHVCRLVCTSQRQPNLQAYNSLLAEFTTQVQQDALAVNAEGFINIDFGLLMSLAVAMVTYFIVLMQFGTL